jgi:hypothetical protein
VNPRLQGAGGQESSARTIRVGCGLTVRGPIPRIRRLLRWVFTKGAAEKQRSLEHRAALARGRPGLSAEVARRSRSSSCRS